MDCSAQVLYAGYVKQGLLATQVASFMAIAAVTYLLFASYKSSRAMAITMFGWLRYVLQTVFAGLKTIFWQIISIIRPKAASQ